MASTEHEPITEVWGQSPQQGPGAEPLVRGSGGRSPPKAESILVIGCPTEPANLAPVRKNSMLCYGPLVSELGGPECNGAPNPVIGDLCPPWLSRLWSSPGLEDECRLSAGSLPTLRSSQSTWAESAVNWQPPSISTYHRRCYYYSALKLILTLPSHGGGRLIRPRHCRNVVQPVPKAISQQLYPLLLILPHGQSR